MPYSSAWIREYFPPPNNDKCKGRNDLDLPVTVWPRLPADEGWRGFGVLRRVIMNPLMFTISNFYV